MLHQTPASRQSILTFDIFDTLIARRFIGPASIFKLLERKYKIIGFAQKRIEAEVLVRKLSPIDFSLMDIYVKLAELIPLDAFDLNNLCEQEIAEEIANCIPISENISLVKDDSILISDMYLKKDSIESLLESVGFCKERMPFILLSNCGKSNGTIWRELRDLNVDCHHIGDNYISDMKNSRLENMNSFISKASRPSFFEDNLFRKGLVLPVAIREARLRTHYIFSQQDVAADIKSLQVNFNIPFLLRAASFIIESCREGSSNSKTLLFASRGSKLLHELTRLLVPHIPNISSISTRYWLSSRQANLNKSTDYINYTLSLISGQPIFVDLNGSGVSLRIFLTHLQESLNNNLFGKIILGYHCPNSLNFTRIKYGLDDPRLIDGKPAASVDNSNFIIKKKCLLECLNYSPEGRLLGMDSCMGQYIPRRDTYEFSPPVKRLVEDQQNYAIIFIKNLVDAMQLHSIEDMVSESLSDSYLQALRESFAHHECLIESIYDKNFAQEDLIHEICYDKAIAEGFKNPCDT